MTITAELVKELRELTGAGMMECKKFLVETSGDVKKAMEAMRKAGLAKADKKSGRIAAEGAIVVKLSEDNKKGVMVEINCETDFVARDENFKHFAEAVAAQALSHQMTDLNQLKDKPLHVQDSETIEQVRATLVGKVGENVQLRRVEFMTAQGLLGQYVHNSRIGVLLELEGGDAQLARDIAMHIAANSPWVIDRSEVSPEIIAKEKEIFAAQAQSSGKPAAVIEKMIEGRIAKFLEEVSLLEQAFVKNPEITVGQLVKQANAKVKRFIRFALGEGIEKVSEDFAESVRAYTETR